MKYMGSKRQMLENGLGEILRDQLPYAKRFIDPFCGSGGVINYVAVNQKFKGEIIAGDLQKYAIILARAVIGRTKELDLEQIKKAWIGPARKAAENSAFFAKSLAHEKENSGNVKKWVKESRKLCEIPSKIGPIWNAYGGHYFSPKQAIIFDYLLKNIPKNPRYKDVCLAAVIVAASRCAAAPGHTAQPFQPTVGAGKFIKISWSLDPFKSCETALKELAPIYAQKKGKAYVSDAKSLISKLKEGDLVLIDPPYSGVQYSRFYHVLETIARGECGEVSGVGRYPAISERPQSKFSNAGQSMKALEDLLQSLAKRRVTVIFTFPKGEASNGLSGNKVIACSKKYFILDKTRTHHHVIAGKFSTLGGNNKVNKNKTLKQSRVNSEELVLLLKPKKK
jgi:adenine-specific DNA-methyltransferase